MNPATKIRHSIFCILPPHMLKEISVRGNAAQKSWALKTLAVSSQMRGHRELPAMSVPVAVSAPARVKERNIYDAGFGETLPGRLVRSEGSPPSKDVAVNEAYDGAGVTYDLYFKIFERNSIDDRGMHLNSTIHYGREYDNAFWDGKQMVYGDGDGELFNRFTIAVDVIGHELTHGVTQYEAKLKYEGQPGALNESFSDVVGSLVKQYQKSQTAADADWLIGQGIFTSKIKGVALRSMKNPGSAYDDPIIGKDPQPGHMRDFVETRDDNGGVHINSGIPNKAFYEAAIKIGGYAWEKAGRIWYLTLRDSLSAKASFKDAAQATFKMAQRIYGDASLESKAVAAGWNAVGIG